MLFTVSGFFGVVDFDNLVEACDYGNGHNDGFGTTEGSAPGPVLSAQAGRRVTA
ncbi:MAG: hypothetical protein LBD12_02555 [Clostridiales Family XIII bacterium]|jgi:hypothetical protein|nr:hypothetical protein [Clostridiales Family XIII bacterium]